MKARGSPNKHDQLGVLPIRVGEGDVEGLLFNAIVPDIRTKSVGAAAELILERLRLIDPLAGKAVAAAIDWLEEPPPLVWPMADHTDVRNAFEQLLLRSAPWRILLVRGPSESGKSHITRQMLRNALRMPGLACGRFDFKGTTDMDDELRVFVQQLDVTLPPGDVRLTERLSYVLDALRRRGQPALLLFDNYHDAASEVCDWVEKQLLSILVRASWLRVVVTGQRVPERNNAIWESDAAPVITLKPPPPVDWLAYGKTQYPDLTLEEVEKFCRHASHKASLLRQLLGPPD
jgi:hypothetical protein